MATIPEFTDTFIGCTADKEIQLIVTLRIQEHF